MISVIVPIYKTAPYLKQCVDSILNQTYWNIEVLLINDGSPDRCGEICEDYSRTDKRVRVFQTENNGLSAARNLGIREANGEYLSFIDSDDWIEPDMFEVLLKTMQETLSDISICGYNVVLERKVATWRPVKMVYHQPNAMAALLNGLINNNVWNKLYRRDLINRITKGKGIFPEGSNYEDIAVMHRIIAEARSVALTSESLYSYRMRPDSISKIYTAKNLLDYADAYLSRYYYFKNEQLELSLKEPEQVALIAAKGISRVWRWWYGCSSGDKKRFQMQIKELENFSRETFPVFGFKSWPIYLQLSSVFMHSSCTLSFAITFFANQIFRKLCPEKCNIVTGREK